jgi:hypothetical protein
MKTYVRAWLVLALACAALSSGCKRSDKAGSTKEPKITGSDADAPVSLVPKWKPGQRYVMRMESDQTMEMPDPTAARRGKPSDKTVQMQNTFAQEYALTVTNAADGNQGIEMEILAIELQTAGPGQTLNYDSRNTVAPQGGPFGETLDAMIGGKLFCLVSPENKVLKVEGFDALLARRQPPVEGAAPGPRRRGPMQAAAENMLRSIYNEQVVKQMLEFSTGIPKSLRVGESWPVNRELSQPQMGTLLLSLTNTFRGWQEHDGQKCARVEFAGSIASKDGDGAASAMTLRDGVMTGRYWFSPDKLMPLETSMDQKYTISMGGSNNAGGFSFTAPVQQTVLLKLLEMKTVESK